MKGYGQFCPVAVASEIFAERWTPLILRELFAGATRFNAIRNGVPLISRTLLARRLRELEDAGVLERRALPRGRGQEYRLTKAGEDFRAAVDSLGAWGQRWSVGQFDADNLDVSVLMWNIRRRIDVSRLPPRRVIIRFEFHGVPAHGRALRTWWLVLQPSDIDLCLKDPGFDVDLVVTADAAALAQVWMGHVPFARAEELGIGAGRHPAAGSAPDSAGPERRSVLDVGPETRAVLDADTRAVLDVGAAEGSRRVAGAAARGAAPSDGGWGVNLGVGTYGDDTLLRALVARVGWGANVPDEAVYPVARVDAGGERLSGEHTYRITFPAGGLPPVDAFWSLSVYAADMFFEPHPSGRYTIGDRGPGLVLGADGSLEIVLSHDEPVAGDGPVNWLPVPEGPFVLMLRLYLPGPEILAGGYGYPAIERVDQDAPA